jgi:hypothetical protein
MPFGMSECDEALFDERFEVGSMYHKRMLQVFLHGPDQLSKAGGSSLHLKSASTMAADVGVFMQQACCLYEAAHGAGFPSEPSLRYLYRRAARD